MKRFRSCTRRLERILNNKESENKMEQNGNTWFDGIGELIEAMGFPYLKDRDAIRFMLPLEDKTLGEMAEGEIFLASSLGMDLPETIDILQLSIICMTEIPKEKWEAMRRIAYLANRQLAGGRFSLIEEEGGGIFDYTHDIPMYVDLPDLPKMRTAEIVLDLAAAYVITLYPAMRMALDTDIDGDAAFERALSQTEGV